MDKHICKAKRVDNGEWVYGLLCYNIYKQLCIQPIEDMNCCVIDKDTICRCTGAKDKNGNMIFEYDIIDASNEWWSAAGPAGHDSPIILVEWDEYVCGFDPFADYDCDCGVYINAYNVTVIGNKFDNTELME